LEEKDLTEKQRAWLALSRKIGPGALTKSEREALEQAYAEMLPREQQDLHDYIMSKASKKESEERQPPAEPDDPIVQMQQKVWHEPSDTLKKTFSRIQTVKRPVNGHES
jgi:hypothetical protein